MRFNGFSLCFCLVFLAGFGLYCYVKILWFVCFFAFFLVFVSALFLQLMLLFVFYLKFVFGLLSSYLRFFCYFFGMVVVDEALVRKVAANARLSLSDDEVKGLVRDLNDVLGYFSLIDSLDVSGVKPSFQPFELKNVFRDDVVGKCVSNDVALSNTKNKRDGYFLGPGVL